MDSGGSSRESRGFTLFIKDSKLYAVVSVPDEVWRVSRVLNIITEMISRGTNDNVFCSIKLCKAMMWIDTRAMAAVGQRFADNSAFLSSDVIHFVVVTA